MFRCNRSESIDQLHNDFHKSGIESLRLPVKVQCLAYMIGDNVNDRNQFLDEFLLLLEKLEVSADYTSITGRFGQGRKDFGKELGELIISWELHSRYYIYQFWFFPGTANKDSLQFGDIELPCPLLDFCPVGIKLSSLEFIITEKDFPELSDIQQFIGGSTLYGSSVLTGNISVYTNFFPDSREMERYLITTSNSHELLDNLEFLVESLIRIENSYHSLIYPLTTLYEGLEVVHRLERELSAHVAEIDAHIPEANTDQLKLWLAELTKIRADVIRLNEKLGVTISATPTYEKMFKQTLRQLNQKPCNGLKPISEFVNRKTMFISTDYSSFQRRIEALGKGAADMISVLRTKIDMNLQEQNICLLHSVDKTTKTQVKLQQMVEGVSLIILAYYMSGLGYYVFSYMGKLGIIAEPLLPTVCFIPVSFLIAYLLTKRIKSTNIKEEEEL